MARYTLSIEMDEVIYRGLEEEARRTGVSVSDLHRLMYKTYFAMMVIIRGEDSELVVRTEGNEMIIREDRFYNLEEVLGSLGESLGED